MSGIVRKLMIFICRLLPLSNIILFESSPDFSDNARALYEYFISKEVNQKYKMIWLYNNPDLSSFIPNSNVKAIYRNSLSLKERLLLIYYHHTAKYIFDSNVYVHMERKGQIRIHLGHGMPIKAPYEYCRGAGNMTNILVTSHFFDDLYQKLFLVNKEQILNFGMPRNDDLLKDYQKIKKELFHNKKVIFWMPTYRQHKNGNKNTTMDQQLAYGLPCIKSKDDLLKLADVCLEENVVILFRNHPAQNVSFISEINNDVMYNINDVFLKKHHLKLYEVLSFSDALITDYSSVYYDYLLTQKPIALTIEDLKAYSETFELALDYQTNIIGNYIYDIEELMTFIQDVSRDRNKVDLLETKEKYHDDNQQSSCMRIYEYLKEKYQF